MPIFLQAPEKLTQQYNSMTYVYDEKEFERRRLCMQRSVFNNVVDGVIGCSLYRKDRDVTNMEQIFALFHAIKVLRVLAYGKEFWEIDELREISASSMRE